eukprot:scaffold5113_cov364-Pinguiococcus_pyrenoidosus.AAC.11
MLQAPRDGDARRRRLRRGRFPDAQLSTLYVCLSKGPQGKMRSHGKPEAINERSGTEGGSLLRGMRKPMMASYQILALRMVDVEGSWSLRSYGIRYSELAMAASLAKQ